jgi:hypothetical protein
VASDNLTNLGKQETSDSLLNERGLDNNKVQAQEKEHPRPNDENDESMREPNQERFRRFVSRFRSEIVFGLLTVVLALLTLTLTLGQYYQSGYSTRIGITTIWQEGYTEDTRNRVAKFTVYESWAQDEASAKRSMDILIDPHQVFNADKIRGDQNLMRLLDDDLKEKARELKTDQQKLTDHDYVAAALKYRNAIIESLNTMEAVEAVIQAKPKLVRMFGSPDLLEERYSDLITERTKDLHPFIERYRCHYKRSTEAWHLLTEKETPKPCE